MITILASGVRLYDWFGLLGTWIFSMMVSYVYNHHRVDGEERPIYLNMYNMVEKGKTGE